MEALPIALFWLVGLWAFIGKKKYLLYLFFCSMPFGSFAVIPPEMTAGLTFTPTPIVALMVIARQFVPQGGLNHLLHLVLNPRLLLPLLLFWISSIFATLFMPRLFAGQVTVIPMRLDAATFGDPLFPTSQNISQLAYMTISVAAVAAFAHLLRRPDLQRHAVYAIIAGGVVTVFTGAVDYVSQYVPISPLLEPFRTATYALITEAKIQGAKRVVGLMPEASSYGALSLSFLAAIYFFRRGLPAGGVADRLVPATIASLVVFTWLSTSSSAYLGFAVFCLAAVLEWLWRAARGRSEKSLRRGLGLEFWTVSAAATFACLIVLFKPSILDPIVSMVDEMVFKKTASSSFEERSMWTAVSWKAFVDTYGLGVGLGGTRASNGVVSIFSNVGFVGGCLYFLFVAQTFLRRLKYPDPQRIALKAAAFWTFLPGFSTAVLAATTPDFGTFNGFLFGVAIALRLPPQLFLTGKRLGKPRTSAQQAH